MSFLIIVFQHIYMYIDVCVYLCACVRACVRACACHHTLLLLRKRTANRARESTPSQYTLSFAGRWF